MEAVGDGQSAPTEPGSSSPWHDGVNYVYLGDNLPILRQLPSESVELIYIDPPFNTGRAQARTRIRTVRDPEGDRVGFQGRRYRTEELSRRSFDDAFDDYLAFLAPRLKEARRLLTRSGTLYVHVDYREVHYVKLLLDGIFDRECFLNEIIWAYDYGGRTTRRSWPPKHDNILVYVKDPEHYFFSVEEIERIPYMAPGLVGRGEGGARQAANRYLVAHHRAHEQQGAHGVPDTEARRHHQAHGAGVVTTRRHRAGFLRGQRDAGGSRLPAGPTIRADR